MLSILAMLAQLMVDSAGADIEDMQCVGHSLGGQMCGFMGKETNGTIGRVTGKFNISDFWRHMFSACISNNANATYSYSIIVLLLWAKIYSDKSAYYWNVKCTEMCRPIVRVVHLHHGNISTVICDKDILCAPLLSTV